MFVTAVLVVAGAGALAWFQKPAHDPFRPPATLSWQWWLSPGETNGFRRLPAVGADLADISCVSTERCWAVGRRGTILATTDGGQRWAPQTSGVQAPLRSVHFADTRTGWIVGSGGMILATTDGGQTWAQQTSGVQAGLGSVYFADTRTGWAVGERGTILATRDGGASWVLQTSGVQDWLESVHFADARTGWAVGEGGTILATRDGGASWTPQNSSVQARLTSVHFADARTGWAVDAGGTILATIDGGASWAPQTSGVPAGLSSVHFADSYTGWTVSPTGMILATTDGGQHWVGRISVSQATLRSVHFANARAGWAVGDRGAILATTDGGANWAPQTSGVQDWLSSVHFANARTGWAVGTGGTIFATTDGGASWVRQTSGVRDLLLSVHFADARTGWAVGEDGTILSTTDGGQRWVRQTSGVRASLDSAHFADARTGGAVGGGRLGRAGTILHTRDGGATWSPQTIGTQLRLSSVHFADARTGWAVGIDGTILATTDGGASWAPQISGVSAGLRSVHFADAHAGWAVGTGGTILATTDGGRRWVRQTSGVSAGLTSVHFADARTGWAVGDGGTILRTTDGGQTWVDVAYSRNPAPVVWVLLALSASGFWQSRAQFRRASAARRVEDATSRVADILATDQPLDKGDPDPIGAGQLAAGLARYLNNPLTKPPLTIAVTGEWGTGKSSVMNLLRREMRGGGFNPVWFNAWHHQKEEHLLAALLENIRVQAIPSWLSRAGLRFRRDVLLLNLARPRLGAWLLLALVAILLGLALAILGRLSVASMADFRTSLGSVTADLKALVDWTTAQTNTASGERAAGPLPGFVALLGSLAAALVAVVRLTRSQMESHRLNPAQLMAQMSGTTKLAVLRDQLDYRHKFREAFKELVAALPDRALLVIIDDLDRCQPKQVLEVLEATNFLVNAGPCFVVFGMASKEVLDSLIAELPIPKADIPDAKPTERAREYARRYLEKLINIEVPVPVMTDRHAAGMIAAARARAMSGRSAANANADRLAWKRRTALAVAAVAFLALVFGLSPWAMEQVREWSRTAATRAPAPPAAPQQRSVGFAWQIGERVVSSFVISWTPASTERSPPPVATPPTPPTGDGRDPRLRPEERGGAFFREAGDPGTPWITSIATSTVVLAGVLLVLFAWRAFGKDQTIVDNDRFKEALEIWAPAVLQARRSPRALKRFINRVRFYAMAYGANAPTSDDPTRPAIDEAELVALTALDRCRMRIDPGLEAVRTTLQTKSQTDAPDDQAVRAAVQQAMTQHEQSWKLAPSSATIERFREISAGVIVR